VYLSIKKLLIKVKIKREDFLIIFNLFNMLKIENFIVKGEKLKEMHKRLRSNSSR
jgi:hypothetical protein